MSFVSFLLLFLVLVCYLSCVSGRKLTVTSGTKTMEKKPFNWVVVATFKNESMILSSWIQHYINEGADHFYLIDNGSQDDYLPLVQHFPQQQMITIVRDSSPPKRILQDILMRTYLTPLVVKNAHWVLVVDIDEYVYPLDNNRCISDVLDSYPKNVHRVWLPWKIFGSNNHTVQPTEGIVQGFTKRRRVDHLLNEAALGYGKSFTRVHPNLVMWTHYSGDDNRPVYYSNGTVVQYGKNLAEVTVDEDTGRTQPLQLNHYMFQSRDYYRRIKCERGGGQSGKVPKYTMAFFDENEPHANAIEDLGLKQRYEVLDSKCQSKYAAVE